MRRLAPAILTLALAACGAGPPAVDAGGPTGGPTGAPPGPSPSPAPIGPSMSCGSVPVTITYVPEGLSRGPRFGRIKSLTRPLEVHGLSWRGAGEELRVGVVCGVHSAERFATLVTRSSLVAHHGKPALHWRTRGDVRNFMWLERPGTAVYVAATPGLARELAEIADGVTP
ncbi:hypothetical protein ACWGH8_37130 [Nonomuraea muscovyensis]|uniref:DUF3558 domain-containing protein n=1 Tax=Nonomuraea muscovyensis TaxID=1124761 RepID=A0A7X0CBN2_9ACTN|nr:hypothetical protein [Nonomuraea muscovyensis]MBB6350369.1 hypothetical protein [Nonomuraea muscovyensis]